MIGLFGGAFDPPHNGHVALLRGAREALGLDDVLVVVAALPGAQGGRDAGRDAARARPRRRSPASRSCSTTTPRTVDMLRDHPEWEGAVFLLGADEFAGFLGWKEPEEVLRLVRLGVATRPGLPRERLDRCSRARATRARRVLRARAASRSPRRELRARLDRGEDVRELVPAAVWELIERDGLYGRGGYTDAQLTSIEQARRIAALAQEKLARDVVILDMQPVCTYTDYFVVCTGNNPRQTKGDLGRGPRPAEEGRRAAAALGRRRARGDLDRRRLPRRRPARLHARGAGLLPPRRPLGRRAPGGARGGERVALLSL